MIDERVALNLDNMKRVATDAISFVEGMSEAEFLASHAVQMACAMCLVIIGESTTRIEKRSPDFVATHPDWPWNKVRGLRNMIVHDYDQLHLPTIWLVVRDSLPDLVSKIEEVGELDPRKWPTAPPQIGS
jgi:uncharacterized protein with HEPN domain